MGLLLINCFFFYSDSTELLLEVDLNECKVKTCSMSLEGADRYEEEQIQTKSEQKSFFPLVIDDYFMAVAILSSQFSKHKVSSDE